MPAPVHIAVVVGVSRPVFDVMSAALKENGLIIVGRGLDAKHVGMGRSYLSEIFAEMVSKVQITFERGTDLRLSIWHYDYDKNNKWVSDIKNIFYPFSCIVKIPMKYYNSPKHTANYVQNTIDSVEKNLNLTYLEITSKRSSSPFVLPMKNFRSNSLVPFCELLIGSLSSENLYQWFGSKRRTFRQEHKWKKPGSSERPCFHDDRGYAFESCRPEEEHGKRRMTDEENGSEQTITCYLNARLRFGATLRQGFHYDVQPPRGRRVAGIFFHCDGAPEDLTSGGYTYVNVFPNDRFEPKKKH